jgi:hypothetical protein
MAAELTLNGKDYYVDSEDMEVLGNWVDNGIGDYEFWGARCNDKRVEFEVESISITKAFDEDENEITDRTILDQLEELAMDDPDEYADLASNFEGPDEEPFED